MRRDAGEEKKRKGELTEQSNRCVVLETEE